MFIRVHICLHTGPSPPYVFKFTYRNYGMGRVYDLVLPEHFKVIYEDYQDAQPGLCDTCVYMCVCMYVCVCVCVCVT